jgi:DNA-binding GntR family transcriptional regulator
MSQITRYAPESVFPTIAGWPEQSTAHHRLVLSALEAHDENLARTAMSEHLAEGAEPLIAHLTARGVVAEPRELGPRASRGTQNRIARR